VTPENPAFGATVLRLPAMQSPNYVTEVSGWFIGQDGSVEFNNAVFRGTVTATEFGAVVTVSAGPYAGTYLIAMQEYTDGDGNNLAVIQWLNQTNPATIPPYLAAVSGPGAGALSSLHSGAEDGSDSEAVIWVESAEASGFNAPLVLFDTSIFQPFGATGPTVFQDGSAWVVDNWHTVTLDSGWIVESGHQAPSYRLLPDGNLQFAGAATHASMTTVTPLNSSSPLDSDYFPQHAKVYRGANPVDGTGPIEYDTTGVIRVRASAADPYTVAEIDGIASLL
jgi:hypothetical protein